MDEVERSSEQMAKVKQNMIVSGLSGSLGKDHYARLMRDGRTIISTKPDFSNRQFSDAQLDQQSRMKQAAAYAKVASKENPVYAELAKGKAKNAYNVALGDWFNPPSIRRIEWRDGQVCVLVRDDVMVTSVTVAIVNEEGLRLEQGQLQLQLGGWWVYDSTTTGRIVVEACDLAGNVTRQEFTPQDRSYSVWEKITSR